MAIQNRRGTYDKFDPQKMLPGEWAVVISGDANALDGRTVYMCFAAGDVKRMATYEDMVDNIQSASGEVIAEQIQTAIGKTIQDCQSAINAANTAKRGAESAAETAANAASTANTAKVNAETAAQRANDAADQAEAVAGGEITPRTVVFTQAAQRENVMSGECTATLFGKVKKWFADLRTAAFCDVSNSLEIQEEGKVLDARQGNVLNGKIGDLACLPTTDKTSLTSAFTELNTKLEYHAGDTIALQFYGAGYMTTGKTQIFATLPLQKPISSDVKSISVTLTTFEIRQSNAYLAQNASGVTVKIVKSTKDFNCINFTKSSGFGGTNNDAVGILAIGTITLS